MLFRKSDCEVITNARGVIERITHIPTGIGAMNATMQASPRRLEELFSILETEVKKYYLRKRPIEIHI